MSQFGNKCRQSVILKQYFWICFLHFDKIILLKPLQNGDNRHYMGNSFGNRLKDIRTDRDISREDLAKQLGTSAAIIGRYERNERTPSIDIAKNIAQALNVSLDFLAGDTSVLVKDKEVLQRIEDISNLSEERKKYIFDFIDMCLRDYKAKKAYAS